MSGSRAMHPIQEIFFSCTEARHVVKEHLIPVHGITRILDGSIEVSEGDNQYTFHAGETVMFRRNQLAKFTKQAPGGEPFRSVSIFFTQDFLLGYYSNRPKIPPPKAPLDSIKILRFGSNPLFDGLFASILPYQEYPGPLPQELIDLKLAEAMSVLRTVDRRVDAILSDFAEPGKLDLVDYMELNFSFNIPLAKFAYLTGRSMATFKRDFKKAFRATPQKWLLQKRLQYAYFLLAEKKLRTTDVYLQAGFENLSHFSAAFKEKFGLNPSALK